MASADAASMGYEQHRLGFLKFHRGTLNVLLHAGLSPAGLLGGLGLIANATSTEVAVGVAAVYAASLAFVLPAGLVVASGLATAGLAVLAARLALGWTASLGLIALSYFGQDLAHWVTGEATYQSSYQKSEDFWALLMQHTYYLLPLVLDAVHATRAWSGVLLWLTPRNDVLFTKLGEASVRASIKQLRDWVVAQKPSESCTTHWWALELPAPEKAAFEAIAQSDEMKAMFHGRFDASQYAVECLPGMNEVYVASIVHNKNSDTVFFMDHVDGPYMLYPFCYVYRTLVAITTNTQISTVFPMQPFRVAISDGEVIGLDFHREVHRIESDAARPNAERRITCKMHYVVYPKCLGPVGRYLGHLTTKYNQGFRYLFVNTISAANLFWQFMTKMVLLGTEMTFRMEQLMGLNNIVFFLGLGAISAFAGTRRRARLAPPPRDSSHVRRRAAAPRAVRVCACVRAGSRFFLAATSFLHHVKAIATYYHRNKASLGKFIRDSIAFKVRGSACASKQARPAPSCTPHARVPRAAMHAATTHSLWRSRSWATTTHATCSHRTPPPSRSCAAASRSPRSRSRASAPRAPTLARRWARASPRARAASPTACCRTRWRWAPCSLSAACTCCRRSARRSRGSSRRTPRSRLRTSLRRSWTSTPKQHRIILSVNLRRLSESPWSLRPGPESDSVDTVRSYQL